MENKEIINEIIEEIRSENSWDTTFSGDGWTDTDIKRAIELAWQDCPHCREMKMMPTVTILGLKIETIDKMKKYFINKGYKPETKNFDINLIE